MPFAILDDPETINKILTSVVVFFATTVVSFVAGRWWGKYQAGREWESKHFLGRIIVSLNSFRDGFLKIRTVLERSLEDVFLNHVAVEKIRSASLKTTIDAPLLPIAKEDRWYLLNFVLNSVAEHFSSDLVRYDAGQNLRPVKYLIFLTCEIVGEDRIRKVRAMLIQKELLENFPYTELMPKLEQEWHSTRVMTLRQAAAVYAKEPDHFLPIEFYV